MKSSIFKSVIGTIFLFVSLQIMAQDIYKVKVSENTEPLAKGPYTADWTSLQNYKSAPEWFRDAKFGIWAHWGPQCEAGDGDWYARGMYYQGNGQYRYQLQHYGHPSQFGFKDVIHRWKAENWNPDKLVSFYKKCGAKYFFALGNHHDNFDLWDSKYQPWNSVNMGPGKDILAGWTEACKKENMPLGISIHASHAWTWYEIAQLSDKKGPLTGIPYDGTLTQTDGAGTWWEGYDPQDLYAQNHVVSDGADDSHNIHKQWNWGNGASIPDQAYCDKFYNRTIDVINRYNPSLLYFDDTVLPLYPISDAGLRIAAHLYNKSCRENNGKNEAVLLGKILPDDKKSSLTWDVERGAPDHIEELPWQTCTCIGSWHYQKMDYYDNRYKSASQVIQMLIDVVSKNGNLLLSVPVRGDGTIDPVEEKIVGSIGEWMSVYGGGIYGTRPWVIYGEGPSVEKSNPINGQGFNEGKIKLTGDDIRFTRKGKVLYAFVLGRPAKEVMIIKNLALKSELIGKKKIKSVRLVGADDKVVWNQNAGGLEISIPSNIKDDIFAFEIMGVTN